LGEEKVIGENRPSKTRGISSTTPGFELWGLIFLTGIVILFRRRNRRK
jgi:LPXTG-motif cell wall-anchored protein